MFGIECVHMYEKENKFLGSLLVYESQNINEVS